MPVAAAAGDVSAGLGVELARVDDQLRGWLEGATDSTVDVARSRVGVRVRSALRNDPRLASVDGVPNSNVVFEIGVQTASELVDLEAIVQASVEPLGDRWDRRLERAEDRINDLTGNVVPPEAWAIARKRSVEVLVDDLTEQIVANLGRSDAAQPAYDMRRALTTAGID